ncbi:noncompact myelin-associated protein [Sardina pilchardus]|uniref:noncompact myelin-associated protein n=1 Tax=Sardina pilchardus TaxID=27697 RepID=UPI002E0F1EB6
MQTSTAQPVTNFTTAFQNTTSTTKSQEQILTQSSGAMIALIVIGIIIILTILLIILKTYNRRTHTSRMMAGVGGSKARKKSPYSTQTNINMSHLGPSSVSGSFVQSPGPSENGFRLPRVDLASVDHNNMDQQSTASGSTVVTVHDAPSIENT